MKSPAKNSELRYERKWILENFDPAQIRAFVLLHPAMFREVYFPRFVNNIYFDSINLDRYYENEAGIANRSKFRIRWYGELESRIERPVLEIKYKRGNVGGKKLFDLNSFELDRDFGIIQVKQLIERSEIPIEIAQEVNSLYPVLVNRYFRSYYVSADTNFRITIDSKLSFMPFSRLGNSLCFPQSDHYSTIVELKYSNDLDLEAEDIIRAFPQSFEKHSKFARGLDSCLW